MIAPLRRRHRWLAPASFAAALVGVLAGVMVRPDAFVDAGSGRDSVLAAPAYVAQAARPVPGIDGLGAALVPGEGDRMDLWLMAEARLEAADVLAYLASAAPSPSGSMETPLPEGAQLLGSVAPLGASRLSLTAPHAAHLVLFSLGQQRVLGSLDLDGSPASTSTPQGGR